MVADEPPPAAACDPEVVRQAVQSSTRLAEVRRTGLLDSPPDESFDRLTRLASRLIGAPAAFISLVDEARDFYVSAHGLQEPVATSRQLTGWTICHYAVAGSEPLVIPDTRAHPVYSQIPTVESLGVGAYLGVPLVTAAGEALGSFCVIDFQPHEWRELDVDVLREFAESTLREIELRLALRDAQSARARGEAAIRAREDIVAVLSHDLRNPIHTIRSSASTLIALPIAASERRRFYEIIHRNAETMTRLVSDLLDISRIEGGGLRLELAPVDPAALLGEALELLTPTAASRGVALEVETAPDLPPVIADRARLHQVLANLVDNAVQFTPASGRVVMRAAAAEYDVAFSVSDSGHGIPAEDLPHIFDRFWQASRARRSGAGLGLAIVAGIVRAHGGAVRVISTPGAGTTFSFSVPTATIDAGAERGPLEGAARS